MKRFLFLDSVSQKDQTMLQVWEGEKTLLSLQINARTWEQSERFWQEISFLSKSNQECVHSSESVVVVVGPGGFTSVRMGVVIANAFAYAKHIPVVGITIDEAERLFHDMKKLHQRIARAKVGEFTLPEYESDPNITQGKGLWSKK